MLPSAAVFNGLASPHAGRAVEVEKHPAARASAVLQHKVPVEQDGLDFRKKRVVAVQVRPARLHHADFRLGEVMDHAHEPVFRGNKVGVKDGDELALRGLHPVL